MFHCRLIRALSIFVVSSTIIACGSGKGDDSQTPSLSGAHEGLSTSGASEAPLLPKPIDLPAQPVQQAGFSGYLPASWNVTANGQFAYSIPLEVPAGRAGMQPSLSLEYVNGGKNGLLGVGWSIRGLSMITRCDKIISTEGVTGGVKYSDYTTDPLPDRFCLDGKKLVSVGAKNGASGAYGQNDTVYRTEEDSFSEITSTVAPQNAPLGPDTFTVRMKSGVIREYEKQLAQRDQSLAAPIGDGRFTSGSTSVGTFPVVWLLTVERDRSGNEIHYDYLPYQNKNGLGGGWTVEYLPLDIQYTFSTNAGASDQTQGFRHVHFNYETRPDQELGWKSGVQAKLTKRLKSIEMQAPNPPAGVGTVWRYDFTYTTSPGSGRSLLHSVRRCGVLGGCQWSKIFTWNEKATPTFTAHQTSWFAPPNVYDPGQLPLYSPLTYWVPPTVRVFDANGDGLDDALYFRGEPGNGNPSSPANMVLGDRDPAGAPQMLFQAFSAENPNSPFRSKDIQLVRPLDIDGDGTSDLWAPGHDLLQYCKQTALHWTDSPGGPLFMPLNTITAPCGFANNADYWPAQVDFADFDGNGLLDLISEHADKGQKLNQITDTHLEVNLNFGADGFGPDRNTKLVPDTTRVTDLRGSGRGDAMVGAHDLRIEETGKMSYDQVQAGSAPAAGPGVRFGDFNGDGLEDTLIYDPLESTDAHILWNTGNGFLLSPVPITNLPHDLGWTYAGKDYAYGDDGIRIHDMNHDGRADIVSFHKDQYQDITILLSDGTGSFTKTDLNADPGFRDAKGGWSSSQVGDFDADGRLDLLSIDSAGWMIVRRQDESHPDLLASVSDEPTVWPREQIVYSNEWTDRPQDKASFTCAYPLSCLRRGVTVVREVISHAHVVDPTLVMTDRTLFYSYEDPVADMLGRGFLGFGTFRIWDPQRPMETVTTYDHRHRITVPDATGDLSLYPNAGRPESVTTTVPILSAAQLAVQPLNALARVTKAIKTYYVDQTTLSGSFQVFPWKSHTTEWEQVVTVHWSQAGGSGAHIDGISEPATPPIQIDGTTEFDALGNLTSRSLATKGGISESSVTTYDYRLADWLIALPLHESVTRAEPDPNTPSVTRTTDYVHDALGRLTSITLEQGNANPDIPRTTALTYDSFGLLQDVTLTAAGVPPRKSHYEYDALLPGAPDERVYVSQIWADHDIAAFRPARWTVVHPAWGVPLAMMDANGVQITMQYDDLGRVVSAKRDGEPVVTISYAGRPDLGGGLNGMITQVQQQMSTSITQTDAIGRTLVRTATGFDGTTLASSVSYDLMGHVVKITEPVINNQVPTTTYAYDSLDRLLEIGLPDGNTKKHMHTMFETRSWDENKFESYVTKDVDGRVIASVNVLDIPQSKVKTTYEYAPFDRLAEVTDDKGNVLKMTYDVRGRRIELDDPDRGVTQFEYDGLGHLRSQTHVATGKTRTYVYDDLGREIEIDDADGVTEFRWDSSAFGIGKLASTRSPDAFRTVARYDGFGRPAGMDLYDDKNVKYSVDYSYDVHGRLETLAYPAVGGSRFTLKYAYNFFGYLREVGDATPGKAYAPLWTVNARNSRMALTDAMLGNDVSLLATYEDLTGRVQTIRATSPLANAPDLVNLGYQYYPNGLTKARQDNVTFSEETFGYDSMLRLAAWNLLANDTPQSVAYTYDSIGNLTSVAKNNVVTETNTYGVNGAQPHTLTNRSVNQQSTAYTYDPLGRLTNGGGRTLTYSTFDLPRTVSLSTPSGGTPTTTFSYDAFEKRVRKSGPDGTTLYLGSLYERREEAQGTTHVFHVQTTDGEVAQVTYGESGAQLSVDYLVSDARGSAVARLDANGQVAERFFYEPFGKRLNSDGSDFGGIVGPVKNGFTGQAHDDPIGLINFKGRMYDPTLRRFLTADPVVAQVHFGQSFNPYSYVLNSPMNFVDPTGFIYCVLSQDLRTVTCDSGSDSGGGSGGGGGGQKIIVLGNGGDSGGSDLSESDGFGAGGGNVPQKSDDTGSRPFEQTQKPLSDAADRRASKIDQPDDSFDDLDELGEELRHPSDLDVRTVGPTLPGTDIATIGIRGLRNGQTAIPYTGHGGWRRANRTMVVPEGTMILMPRHNHKVMYAGEMMERRDFAGLKKLGIAQAKDPRLLDLAKDIPGMTLYLPGAVIPNYELWPPNAFGPGFTPQPGSKTVPKGPVMLSKILQENMGLVIWASCTEDVDLKKAE